jgi:hypothetical protein
MTSKNTNTSGDGNYFHAHAGKEPPAFVSPKGHAAGSRKSLKGPTPRPDGSQPKSANTDYLLKSEQQQQLQDKGGA